MEFDVPYVAAHLDDVPDEAGCYVFKTGGTPIYVGKAKSLRKRLGQYLGPKPVGDPKTVAMLEGAATVEFVFTANETEALLLEMTLIRRYAPKYNVAIHGFPYLKITAEKYPRLFITRETPDETTGRYWGPFTDASAVRRTVELTNRAFKLRVCKYDLDGHPPPRPCLDYAMGTCLGPCAGVISSADYGAAVERAVRFIIGRRAGVLTELKRRMDKASAGMAYEEAAHWRDVIKGLRRAIAGQTVVVKRKTEADAFAVERRGANLYAVVLRVREGLVVDRVAVRTRAPIGDELEEFLLAHYGAGAEVPKVVALPRRLGDAAAVAASLAALRGGAVKVETPRRGDAARLVSIAAKNMQYFIETTELSRARRGELAAAFDELKYALGLETTPRHIEMVDISNTGGKHVVGSLVAFRDGVPDKTSYRRYMLKTLAGQDDFGALAEVAVRRFVRARGGGLPAPDVFLVDGGVGQLSAVLGALDESARGNVKMAAFAKDPDRLFTPGQNKPVVLNEGASLFLARIRDEAHRFAVTYHRKVRGQALTRSLLDDIPGIGPRRKRSLLRYFGSLTALAEATIEEVGAVPGIPPAAARAVFEKLHGGR